MPHLKLNAFKSAVSDPPTRQASGVGSFSWCRYACLKSTPTTSADAFRAGYFPCPEGTLAVFLAKAMVVRGGVTHLQRTVYNGSPQMLPAEVVGLDARRHGS